MPVVKFFWPRESGAYAELAFPLITGFLLGGVTWAGAGFAVAVTGWFLANEPLSVRKGLRGERQREEFKAAADVWVVVLGALGLAGAVAGLWLGSAASRWAAVPPAALALALAPVMARGRPKTLGTELVVAAAFAAMLAPVALAGSRDVGRAAVGSGVWLVCFWLATFAVHAIKARARPDLAAPWTRWVSRAASLGMALAAVLAVAAGMLPSPAGYGVLPAAVVTLAATLAPVHPRHLKRVGWSLVTANVVTVVLLVLP